MNKITQDMLEEIGAGIQGERPDVAHLLSNEFLLEVAVTMLRTSFTPRCTDTVWNVFQQAFMEVRENHG